MLGFKKLFSEILCSQNNMPLEKSDSVILYFLFFYNRLYFFKQLYIHKRFKQK